MHSHAIYMLILACTHRSLHLVQTVYLVHYSSLLVLSLRTHHNCNSSTHHKTLAVSHQLSHAQLNKMPNLVVLVQWLVVQTSLLLRDLRW